MPYVYSTLTAPQEYAGWGKGNNDIPRIRKAVRINGGANLATKQLITPRGAVTEVSEEDAEFLRQHPVFKIHAKNGFVLIENRNQYEERTLASLEQRDPSSPDTPDDIEKVEVRDGQGGTQTVHRNKREK
ncbi:MAG: hypothetical protein LBP58_06880 [Azoarcus sp.]|jgi:hypothetical protein|nr:hypothetical protein [Azoarcus sp.]